MNTPQEQVYDDSLTEDQLLWESFKKRDKRAVDYIIDTHYEKLLKYGELLENASDLNDVWTIGPFLRRCLINEILRKEKRYKIETPQSLLDTHTLESIDFDVPDEPDNVGIPEEVRRHLHEACDCLSDKQRQIFHLRFYENRRFKEIASILDIEFRYTKTLFYRGKRKLQKFGSHI